MIEYYVILRRRARDVCVFRDEDKQKAVAFMRDYVKRNGFTIVEKDGRFTVSDVVLSVRESIVNGRVLSETSYVNF